MAYDFNGRTALYRLLAENGRLLYIGIANNPDTRFGQHSTAKPWWSQVRDRKVEWFATRELASAAEIKAIKEERPKYNIQHAIRTEPAALDWGVKGALAHLQERAALPCDLPAEQHILGSMMLSRNAIIDTVVVVGTDFHESAHELIHGAILDLFARDEPADPITVAAELTRRGEITRAGGPAYLHTLVNSVATAANAEYYAEIVRERAILRRLVEAGLRIAQIGHTAHGDIDEIVSAAKSEIQAVTR